MVGGPTAVALSVNPGLPKKYFVAICVVKKEMQSRSSTVGSLSRIFPGYNK
jgi:hypothetical protein